jgi:hypothetical protein
MKRILVLLLSLLTLNVFANANRVGDSIRLEGVYEGYAAIFDMSYTYFDGTFMGQTTNVYIDGQLASQSTEELDSDSIVTLESAGLLVALCPQIGGVQEYLDLPVGRTLTCRITANKVSDSVFHMYKSLFAQAGTIWLGPFPVNGVAQMDLDGFVMRVTSYHWN